MLVQGELGRINAGRHEARASGSSSGFHAHGRVHAQVGNLLRRASKLGVWSRRATDLALRRPGDRGGRVSCSAKQPRRDGGEGDLGPSRSGRGSCRRSALAGVSRRRGSPC